jgi:hypothetical protein
MTSNHSSVNPEVTVHDREACGPHHPEECGIVDDGPHPPSSMQHGTSEGHEPAGFQDLLPIWEPHVAPCGHTTVASRLYDNPVSLEASLQPMRDRQCALFPKVSSGAPARDLVADFL